MSQSDADGGVSSSSHGTRGNVHVDGLGELRRSHMAEAVDARLVGSEVTVMGWAHSHRDHGGLIFVDLRDRSGVVQLVFDREVDDAGHGRAEEIRSEFVVAARGMVRRRDPEDVNPKLPTGEIEVEVSEVRILNAAVPGTGIVNVLNSTGLNCIDNIIAGYTLAVSGCDVDLRNDKL